MKSKNQILSVRIKLTDYDKFEILCRENRINMTDILRASVYEYLSKFELLANDSYKPNNAKGG